MLDGPLADFQFVVDIHLSHFQHKMDEHLKQLNHNGEVLLRAPFLPTSNNHTVIIPVNASVVQYRMTVPKGSIDLWWPVNMGDQTLYELEISYRNIRRNIQETGRLKRKIGFRAVALITYNEYDDDHLVNATEEGSGVHGMYFRINGALVLCRG